MSITYLVLGGLYLYMYMYITSVNNLSLGPRKSQMFTNIYNEQIIK